MSDEGINIDEKTVRVFKKKGYKIDKKLNAGAYGQVYRAIKDGLYYAVKVMDLTLVSKKIKAKFIPRELQALIQVRHPHIIETFDIFKSNKRIYIFMEFAGGGDIARYLQKNGAMDEIKAYEYFSQVCDALNYLHYDKRLAHRDIKLENILLIDDQKTTKLTDFGFTKESWDNHKQQVILSDTFCGTEPYYSPEILKRQRYDPFKSDVWAMGVVLFGLTNNKFPFNFKKGNKQQITEVHDPGHLEKRYTKKFSKHYKELQNSFFTIDESKRLNMKDVSKHKWIREKGKCKH